MKKAARAGEYRQLPRVVSWLASNPPLHEIRDRFPTAWSQASEAVGRASAGGPGAVEQLVGRLVQPSTRPTDHLSSEPGRVHRRVRDHVILRLIRAASVAAESGVTDGGRVRFGLVNGWLLQRVFFERGLRRKPVSIWAYRVAWRVAWQRRRLMPLVRSKGIYCFYSRPFIRALRGLAQGREVLEIAAGDGTLSRFLSAEGVSARATDDHGWDSVIDYGTDVERSDARAALRKHSPRVVICSWPPPGNPFERAVFETRSVETYVVITSITETGASDWRAYDSQRSFDMRHDKRLSDLVLPRGSNRVLVFQRCAG